jgi:predicted ester cyclase
MTREEISALLHQAIEAMYSSGDATTHQEVSHPERVSHMYGQRQMQGTAPVGALSQQLRTAFPDLHVEFEDLLVDGDRAALRLRLTGTHKGTFMGVAPTGKAVEWESIGIAHFRDGQMYRVWVQPDLMGLLQQLGVEMPAMASHQPQPAHA